MICDDGKMLAGSSGSFYTLLISGHFTFSHTSIPSIGPVVHFLRKHKNRNKSSKVNKYWA